MPSTTFGALRFSRAPPKPTDLAPSAPSDGELSLAILRLAAGDLVASTGDGAAAAALDGAPGFAPLFPSKAAKYSRVLANTEDADCSHCLNAFRRSAACWSIGPVKTRRLISAMAA